MELAMPLIDSIIRCHHRDSAGRRCRLPREKSHPTFCTVHIRPAAPDSTIPPADVSAELLGPLNDFRTNTSINYTLGRLLILKSAGQISAKDAAVVAYICQLLLQSVPGVRKEMSWSRGQSPEDQDLRAVLKVTTSLWDDDAEPAQPAQPRPRN